MSRKAVEFLQEQASDIGLSSQVLIYRKKILAKILFQLICLIKSVPKNLNMKICPWESVIENMSHLIPASFLSQSHVPGVGASPREAPPSGDLPWLLPLPPLHPPQLQHGRGASLSPPLDLPTILSSQGPAPSCPGLQKIWNWLAKCKLKDVKNAYYIKGEPKKTKRQDTFTSASTLQK